MIRIDMDPGIGGKMDRIGKAINRALVFTLSDAARFAKDDFLNEVKSRIDRPAPFTTRADGYGIIFARFDDPNPSSMLLIKDKQSGYLNYVIGRRKDRGRSDPGASAKHVWVPGQRPGVMVAGQYSIRQRFSRYGGVEDEYSQYLYMLAHQQFAQKVSRSLGMKAGAGDTKKAVYSTGGVFYGTIKGRKGFWARPKRSAPISDRVRETQERKAGRSLAAKQRTADGRFIPTGRGALTISTGKGKTRRSRTDVRVKSLGIPFLLLKTGPFNDGRSSTQHHKIIDYERAMAKGNERSIRMYPERLRHQLSK